MEEIALEAVAERERAVEERPDADSLVAVRASRPDEMLRVLPILKEYHAESRYGHIPFSERKFKQVYMRAINNPDDTLLVYIRQGEESVGLLHAGVGDYYLGEGGRMVTVFGIYTSARIRGSLLSGRVALKLVRIVTDWAKTQKAEELHIHSTAGVTPQRTDTMLRRLGFRTYGGNYVAPLA